MTVQLLWRKGEDMGRDKTEIEIEMSPIQSKSSWREQTDGSKNL